MDPVEKLRDLHGHCDLWVATLDDYADDPDCVEEIREEVGGWEVMVEYQFSFGGSGCALAEVGFEALCELDGALFESDDD